MDAVQIFFGRKKRFAFDIHIHSTKHAVGCLGMQAKQPPTARQAISERVRTHRKLVSLPLVRPATVYRVTQHVLVPQPLAVLRIG
jgi:hypothetical protein